MPAARAPVVEEHLKETPLVMPAAGGPVMEEHFITVGADGNFMDGCRTFFPAGWNQCAVHQTQTIPSTRSHTVFPGSAFWYDHLILSPELHMSSDSRNRTFCSCAFPILSLPQ